MLTGSATDVNAGASLTYCWEQTDAVPGTNYPSTTQTTGPVYRSRNQVLLQLDISSNVGYFCWKFNAYLGSNT